MKQALWLTAVHLNTAIVGERDYPSIVHEVLPEATTDQIRFGDCLEFNSSFFLTKVTFRMKFPQVLCML